MRVCIVDDSELIQERLLDMLSRISGVEVVAQATSPSEAIEALRQQPIDVVILDIQMPGGSGLGILKTIKASEPSPLVIMLTNYPYPQYRKKSLEAGASFFFDKAVQFEEVVRVLKRMASELE